MNFRQYSEKLRKEAFPPPRKKVGGSVTLPHVPGSLSQKAAGDSTSQAAERSQAPTEGEVVGTDQATGEKLVRQAGDRVVRLSAPQASPGNTVSSKDGNRSAVPVSTKVTSNSGWQPIPGKPGKSSLTVTTQTRLEGLDLLGDPCVPPSQKIEVVQAARAKGLVVAETGIVGVTDGRGNLAIEALNQSEEYLKALYKQAREAGKQSQTLPQALSLDGDGGTASLASSFQAGEALLWKCVGLECVQAVDGFFATKEQCQANCGPDSYECVNGQCVKVPGLTGKFKTLQDCVAQGCGTRWACVDGEPVPSKTGEFATRQDAIDNGCYWGYSCDGTGGCTPEIGGAFKSLACCQSGCEDVSSGLVVTFTPGLRDQNYVDIGAYRQTFTRPQAQGSEATSSVVAAPTNLRQPVSLGMGTTSGSPTSTTHWALVHPDSAYKRLTLTGLEVDYYPATAFSGQPSQAQVLAFLGPLQYAENVVVPHTRHGLLDGRGEFWANPSYKGFMQAQTNPITLGGLWNYWRGVMLDNNQNWIEVGEAAYTPQGKGWSLARPVDWNNLSQANPAAQPGDFQGSQLNLEGLTLQAYGDRLAFQATTTNTPLTSWVYTEGLNQLRVVYPSVVFEEKPVRGAGYTGGYWDQPDNRAVWDQISKPPGCWPGQHYQQGNGQAFVWAENPGVNFRVTQLITAQACRGMRFDVTIENMGAFPESYWASKGWAGPVAPPGSVPAIKDLLAGPNWGSTYPSASGAVGGPGGPTC